MTTSLIEHERIRTTVPRAKEVRRVAEQMVTLAKHGIWVNYIMILGDKLSYQRASVTVKTQEAMDKLFDTLAGRYKYDLCIIIIII